MASAENHYNSSLLAVLILHKSRSTFLKTGFSHPNRCFQRLCFFLNLKLLLHGRSPRLYRQRFPKAESRPAPSQLSASAHAISRGERRRQAVWSGTVLEDDTIINRPQGKVNGFCKNGGKPAPQPPSRRPPNLTCLTCLCSFRLFENCPDNFLSRKFLLPPLHPVGSSNSCKNFSPFYTIRGASSTTFLASCPYNEAGNAARLKQTPGSGRNLRNIACRARKKGSAVSTRGKGRL